MQVKSVSKERSQKAVEPADETENEMVVSPVSSFDGGVISDEEKAPGKWKENVETSVEQLGELNVCCSVVAAKPTNPPVVV